METNKYSGSDLICTGWIGERLVRDGIVPPTTRYSAISMPTDGVITIKCEYYLTKEMAALIGDILKEVSEAKMETK